MIGKRPSGKDRRDEELAGSITSTRVVMMTTEARMMMGNEGSEEQSSELSGLSTYLVLNKEVLRTRASPSSQIHHSLRI
jgi:hypothetical protein